ncbi:hypothetical protein F4824DRAFT_502682 [Ustulina deusta]|nr:hypothetical protein F4824DRAFT_502682 [Ustulina deusta]
MFTIFNGGWIEETYNHLTGEFRGNRVRCHAHVYLDRGPWDQKRVIGECVVVQNSIDTTLSHGYYPVHGEPRNAGSSTSSTRNGPSTSTRAISQSHANSPASHVDSTHQNRRARNYYYCSGSTSHPAASGSDELHAAQPTSWEQYSDWEPDSFYRRKRYNYYTNQWEYQ